MVLKIDTVSPHATGEQPEAEPTTEETTSPAPLQPVADSFAAAPASGGSRPTTMPAGSSIAERGVQLRSPRNNPQMQNNSGVERVATAEDLAGQNDFARGPLLEGGLTWEDREEVCDLLSQIGMRGDGVKRDNGPWRCLPSSFIGAAIMTDPNPPAALVSVCDDLHDRFAADNNLPARDRSFRCRHLKGIEARLANGSVTHGDIHTLQQYLYDVFGEGNEGVRVDPELNLINNLTSLGSFSVREKVRGSDFLPDVDLLLDALLPGQSAITGISSNQDGVLDHAVVLGRDLDGKIFLYDPQEPIKNDEHGHVLYRDADPNAFYKHLHDRGCIGKGTNGRDVLGVRVPSRTAFLVT